MQLGITTLYVFVDDGLLANSALARWRRSPHHAPAFTDAEVLTIALLQGCLGVASLKPNLVYRCQEENGW